ncbi:NUDIX domain-containing protein [Pseudohalocynthiibacter aestuariivivens]|uniref:ADP-ribose pyrophosphatase n=2 Tax=Pseudohalocynthiibacter aestuariivivens TaxID=1591409 RepID=A0ABV5JEV5_9RHOB
MLLIGGGTKNVKQMFFYGTLCHRPLLEVVLNRSVSEDEMTRSRLPDHAVYWAKGQIFPLITEEVGSVAEGVSFDASEEDVARLNYYEGGFHYDLHLVTPIGETSPVEVYFPRPGQWQKGASWSLEDFVEQYGAVTLIAAADVAELFGQIDADEVARRLQMLRARARKIVSVHSPTPSGLRYGFGQADVSLLNHERAYDSFFALDDLDLSHRRFDGTVSAPLRRSVFVTSDAVIVLPYDPARDRVLLVEQFRVGAFMRGDRHPWTLEPIAGRIDKGETPEDAAHREAKEEAGLTLTDLQLINRHYPTPGAATEYFHTYLGLCDLPDEVDEFGGVSGEGEDIRTHVLCFEQLMALVESGEAEIGPLVLSAFWLALNRDRLRADA